MAEAPSAVRRRKLPLEHLSQRASARAVTPILLDLDTPVDRHRLFVCPTVTPLFYTKAYSGLSPEQALRANQITALYFNELIGFFERAFAPHVLTALSRAGGPPELREGLAQFLAEEARHSEMFRRLNRLSEPGWYAERDEHVLVVPRPVATGLGLLARHPMVFPLVLWIMLAMEEHSIEVSRRCAQVPRETIDPQWAAVYHAHLEDEVRHVQLDWHLLDRFYAPLSAARRRVNAALLRFVVGRFLLTPSHASMRVIALLVREFPELRPLRSKMTRELRALGRDPAYVAMMYSRASTPLTFALFDRFPELGTMARVIATYIPGDPS